MTSPAQPSQATTAAPDIATEVNTTTPVTASSLNVPSSKLIKTPKPVLWWMLAVFIVGVVVILWAWRLGPFNRHIQTTDNSYIKGQTTVLSSQINGYVQSVNVKDFDWVKKGQVLMQIDTSPYEQKVLQAASGLDQANNNLANQSQAIEQHKADIAAAQAKVEQARAAYQLALAQQQRYQHLGDSGAVSKAEQDKASADVSNNSALLKQAEANVLVAEQVLKTAQVAKTGLAAQVHSAQAQLDQAQITKNYSNIIAPMDGQLGEVTPRLGQYVAAGSQLLFLIPKRTWVIANFKETQISDIKIGQKAWFTVDALNHQKFYGRVEQIAPAAGSEFSVLKPDNTTGNFTKVVQRISVRIAIDPEQSGLTNLRPGMSVVSSIDTRSKPLP